MLSGGSFHWNCVIDSVLNASGNPELPFSHFCQKPSLWAKARSPVGAPAPPSPWQEEGFGALQHWSHAFRETG